MWYSSEPSDHFGRPRRRSPPGGSTSRCDGNVASRPGCHVGGNPCSVLDDPPTRTAGSCTSNAGPHDMRGSNIGIQDRPDRADRADRRSSRQWSEADGSACDTLAYGRRNGGFHRARSLKSGDANVAALAFRNSEVVEANMQGSRANFFSLEDWGMCPTFAGLRSSRRCSTHSFLCR